jgi:ubiquinone/menaquinone biosynthesis C-methylase UbiE
VEAQIPVSDGSQVDKHYFDQAYRNYELQNPPRKLDYYLAQIEARVLAGSKDILDIGCGLGSFLERVDRAHPDWTLAGSDIDLEGVTTTRLRVPRATVHQASAEQDPFPPGSFDIITAWDVIEHVPDLGAVASAVTRMLRPRGLFMFVVPVYDGVTGPLIRRLDKDPTHIHKQSRAEWVAWARRHFGDVEWHGVVRYLVGRSYLHLPTSRFRGQTPAILVGARNLDDGR